MSARAYTTREARSEPAVARKLQAKPSCDRRSSAWSCSKQEEPLLQRYGGLNTLTAPPIVEEVLRAPGQPLDRDMRSLMESRLGHDFSHVRVHTDPTAAESAAAVGALAYTVGSDIAFGAGQYAPRTSAGQRLLAHEMVHTVQQCSDGSARRTHVEFLRPSQCIAEIDTGEFLLQRTCSAHPDELSYRGAPNYCKDTKFSGSMHPGQRCYREVPRRTGYFNCPPGDQVCFDETGHCHDSYDKVSPVESKDPGTGECNLHGLCLVGHGFSDVLPPMMEESARRHLECLRSCEQLPWYLRGFCIQGCDPQPKP